MNFVIQWFGSPGWMRVVEALLHSLWIGALSACLLVVLFRCVRDPWMRYRFSLGCLGMVFAGVLIAWSVLDHTAPQVEPATPSVGLVSRGERVEDVEPGMAAGEPSPAPSELASSVSIRAWVGRWIQASAPWLAPCWALGALLMLIRGGSHLVGASRLLKRCKPVEDEALLRVWEQARETMRVGRKVRFLVCDAVSSPSVAGWWQPALIVPLSLITFLPHESIRLVLLHELAHIRRGDYLANLLQMSVESLLFFNPAVWWISRQARLEREACCDAMALEAGGNPVAYAKVLLHVAESCSGEVPEVAMTFGGGGKTSSLVHRVERILFPESGRLRLTWRSLLLWMVSAASLFALAACATRMVVAQVLTTEQRIAQVSKLLKEHGESPLDEPYDPSARIEIQGRIRTEDGSPLPSALDLALATRHKNSTGFYSGTVNSNGSFRASVPMGQTLLSVRAPGMAPAVASFQWTGLNQVQPEIELILRPGFPARIRVVDGATGQPVENVKLRCQYWLPGFSGTHFPVVQLTTDREGVGVLNHASNLPLHVSLESDHHELTEVRFETVLPAQDLVMRVRRGGVLAGRVLDRMTGDPLAGATIHVLYQQGRGSSSHNWADERGKVATTDAQGYFRTERLSSGSRSWIGVQLPGKEKAVWPSVIEGETNLVARLGPPQVVRGKIVGVLEGLETSNGQKWIRWVRKNPGPEESYSSELVPLREEQGAGHFIFTNHYSGTVALDVGGRRVDRVVDAPVDGWVVDLGDGERKVKPGGEEFRRVWLRFGEVGKGGIAGTVKVVAKDTNSPAGYYSSRDVLIEQGQARIEVAVGSWFTVEPSRTTLGYWFAPRTESQVSAGREPWIIDVPILPAGVITATARTEGGLSVANVSFSIEPIRLARGVKNPHERFAQNDSWSSTDGPRKFISQPLPLGGDYRVIAWRGNAFAMSEAVRLTGETPSQAVALTFPRMTTLEVQLADSLGNPVHGVEVHPMWSIGEAITGQSHSFVLKPIISNRDGRCYLEEATPDVGLYSFEIRPGLGWRPERAVFKKEAGPLRMTLVAVQRESSPSKAVSP